MEANTHPLDLALGCGFDVSKSAAGEYFGDWEKWLSERATSAEAIQAVVPFVKALEKTCDRIAASETPESWARFVTAFAYFLCAAWSDSEHRELSTMLGALFVAWGDKIREYFEGAIEVGGGAAAAGFAEFRKRIEANALDVECDDVIEFLASIGK